MCVKDGGCFQAAKGISVRRKTCNQMHPDTPIVRMCKDVYLDRYIKYLIHQYLTSEVVR